MSWRFRHRRGISCPPCRHLSAAGHRALPASALLALALLILTLLQPATPGSAAAGFPLVLRDALGRQVVVARPPRRIVSVAPSVTEILFALRAGDQVVGVSDADDYPSEVRTKVRVGGVVLNTERIVALRPDLIIGVAGLQREPLERLIRLRLPVLAVEARTLEETLDQIALLGRVTDHASAGERLVALLRARIATVVRRTAGRPRPRVYVEIWDEPLQTAARGTFIDDLVRRGGGRNVFGDLAGWPHVAPEVVLRRDPEVILLTYPGAGRVRARPGWMEVTAVRRRRLYELDPDLVSRPGPRLVDGLERIARLLHPEAFTVP